MTQRKFSAQKVSEIALGIRINFQGYQLNLKVKIQFLKLTGNTRVLIGKLGLSHAAFYVAKPGTNLARQHYYQLYGIHIVYTSVTGYYCDTIIAYFPKNKCG